jgi:hypothetical protein
MNCDTCAAFSSSHYVFGKNSDRHVGERQYLDIFDYVHENLLNETISATFANNLSILKIAQDSWKVYRQHFTSQQIEASISFKDQEEFCEKIFNSSLPHVISRPYHMYGAEMAFNQRGVTIGNEAVFCPPESKTKRTLEEINKNAITGMDALRIAVMFASDSFIAVSILAAMVKYFSPEFHNEGFKGDCGDGTGKNPPMIYHNAFLICDAFGNHFKFFALGPHWFVIPAAITEDITSPWKTTSISNRLSHGIMKDQLIAHSGLSFLDFAKWGPNLGVLFNSPEKCLRTNIFPSTSLWFQLLDCFANGKERECATKCILTDQLEKIPASQNISSYMDLFDAMSVVLRSHQCGEESNNKVVGVPLQELSSLTQVSVCMHGGVGPVRENQTANSLIVVVETPNSTSSHNSKNPKIWAFSTQAQNPCISIFSPVLIENGNHGSQEQQRKLLLGQLNVKEAGVISQYASNARWTLFEETIRRCTILGVEKYLNNFAKACRRVEQKWLQEMAMSCNHCFTVFNPLSTSVNEVGSCSTSSRMNFTKEFEEEIQNVLDVWWRRTRTLEAEQDASFNDEGFVVSRLLRWKLKREEKGKVGPV